MSAIPWVVMAASSAVSYYTNPIAAPGEPGYTPMPQHHFRVGFENDCAFHCSSSCIASRFIFSLKR